MFTHIILWFISPSNFCCSPGEGRLSVHSSGVRLIRLVRVLIKHYCWLNLDPNLGHSVKVRSLYYVGKYSLSKNRHVSSTSAFPSHTHTPKRNVLISPGYLEYISFQTVFLHINNSHNNSNNNLSINVIHSDDVQNYDLSQKQVTANIQDTLKPACGFIYVKERWIYFFCF